MCKVHVFKLKVWFLHQRYSEYFLKNLETTLLLELNSQLPLEIKLCIRRLTLHIVRES